MPGSQARFHYAFGRFMAFWGWHAGAAQAFRDALDHAPSYLEAQLQLGEALGRAGQWGAAADALAHAARSAPRNADLMGSLLVALARAERWPAAVETAERLTLLAPGRAEPVILLGGVQRRARRPQDAIRTFRRALHLPVSPTRFLIGEALFGPKAWEELLSAHRQAVEREPA